MQKLTKVQITILIVLFCTAVILGILAFSPLERESEEEIARPMLTPQTVEFKLAEPTPSPVPIPLPTITPEPITAIEPSENGSNPILQNQSALFALDIKGEKVDIAYGVEKDTLDETPGWLETSAYPGEEGVCVIYGHRNRNHLKALKGVEIGDTLSIETYDSVFSYKVVDIQILEGDEHFLIPAISGKYLLVSTCYPFHYSGSAPKKCVVWGKKYS